MLTKDFIREVRELGFEIVVYPEYFSIFDGESPIAYVSKRETFCIDTAYGTFNYLSEESKEKLYSLIHKYISTPIDEREEPQKFYLQLTTLIAAGTSNYLNYNTTNGSFVLSGRCQTPKWQTQFTQAEIDEMKEKFGVALSGFEKIPVKDEEIEEC